MGVIGHPAPESPALLHVHCKDLLGSHRTSSLRCFERAAGELDLATDPESYTMKWHSKESFSRGQKEVEVIGPIEGLDKITMDASDKY